MVSNTVSLDIGTSDGKIYGYTALIGAGTGVYFTARFAVAQGVVPASELSNSVGFMAIGQMLGQVTILSVVAPCARTLASEGSRTCFPMRPLRQSFSLRRAVIARLRNH